MQGVIYITGVIGEDTNLLDIIRQVKANKNATSFLVKIDSVGGIVEVGESIFNYLKNLDKPVTTYATMAYSIASVIFMAGSTRIVSEAVKAPLMIHLPSMEINGSHEMISYHLSELKNIENRLATFYSDVTELDKDTIYSLLQNETFLSPQESLELGFATQIQAAPKAVAILNNNNEKEESSMNKKQTDMLSAIYNFLVGKKEIKNELILQDATGIEINFSELNEGDNPEAGDVATVEGKKADGEYLLHDGSILVFEGGVLKETKPAEVEEVENLEDESTEEETQEVDKDARIAELEAENETLKARIAELEGVEAIAEAKEAETDKLLEVIEISAKKVTELEAKYNALAKQVGSDFQPETKKENNPAIQAKEGERPAFTMKRK